MSRLPEAETAVIDESKIIRYLLSDEHPTGRAKAQFFAGFGFRLDVWEVLRDSLLRHARDNEVKGVVATQFGTKYQIDGPLATPDGRNPLVRAVWFVEKDQERPRFVTAYPI